MHVPINVKSPNSISKWQVGFNSAFKGLKYVQCFILQTVLAVRVSFPTRQPFTHSVSAFTSGKASEVDLCSVHVIPPNQRGEALERWFTLHLHTFSTDEHNAKPATNDFAMNQEEKHRARTMNSISKANSYVAHINIALFSAVTD
jgi:hypothetical protein